MKMCRMRVTKLDHIKSQHIRGMLHMKEAIVDKVKNERNDWFAKVHSQCESKMLQEETVSFIQCRTGSKKPLRVVCNSLVKKPKN